MDKENKNQILFILIYLAVYFGAMILISRPWYLKMLVARVQTEMDELRGMHPLSGAQEMMIREFRDRVSEWDHAQRTARKDSKGDN